VFALGLGPDVLGDLDRAGDQGPSELPHFVLELRDESLRGSESVGWVCRRAHGFASAGSRLADFDGLDLGEVVGFSAAPRRVC